MFLIYGEDAFLIKMQKNKILKKINPDNEYDLQEYNYLEDSLLTILNDANTIPLFSEKRIIIINDSYFITEEKIKAKVDNKEHLLHLMEYLISPNPSTFMIFVCPVNNISNRLKITKKMLELTSVLKATNLSYNELTKFIDNYVIKNNGTIKQNLINKIVEYLPNNLYIIKNELKKLLLIDKVITNDLIENNMTKYLDTDIFKLVDDLLKNDLNNFLINYHYLQERGLSSIALLALITNSVIFTRDIIVLSALKKTPSQIAEILQIHPFRVKKIAEHMHNFNIEKANNIIKELFWIDYNIKKGIIRKKISSDLYLIKLFDIN
ncbi:DNA polymerase III subunit delta [Spiroplasma sp. SV19]|uniref:DNA polymerase III subunit delta n=1 Tax=Spiroplasma sp. SV19 TaxID=2570468 RepID=UPI0024B714C7|nr:DNA polymerase III subunit delta [Spiroplasma sp. SV19]WHQ36992.1 DNA polymerase III subunit delta [Spiroplasma sp. SV19]